MIQLKDRFVLADKKVRKAFSIAHVLVSGWSSISHLNSASQRREMSRENGKKFFSWLVLNVKRAKLVWNHLKMFSIPRLRSINQLSVCNGSLKLLFHFFSSIKFYDVKADVQERWKILSRFFDSRFMCNKKPAPFGFRSTIFYFTFFFLFFFFCFRQVGERELFVSTRRQLKFSLDPQSVPRGMEGSKVRKGAIHFACSFMVFDFSQ